MVDRAGNRATVSHVFGLTTLTGSPAAARLREQTVPVGSDGIARFSPTVDADGFTLALPGSARVGHGAFNRAFGFTDATVRFTRPDGTQQTTTIPTVSGSTSHRLAVVAPSDQSLAATLAAQIVALPDLQVAAPPGFAESGTTATLGPAAADLGSVSPASSIMLNGQLSGSIPVTMIIARCTTLTAACSVGGVTNRAVAYLPLYGWIEVPIPNPIVTEQDADTTHALQDPGCEPLDGIPCGQDIGAYSCPTNAPDQTETVSGCGQSNVGQTTDNGKADYLRASLVLGCAPSLYTGGQNLCSGDATAGSNYARLFDHLFVYADPGCITQAFSACEPASSSPPYVGVWSQSHAMVDQGSCPNGLKSGSVTGTLTGLAMNFQAAPSAGQSRYELAEVATTDKFNVEGELSGDRTEWGAMMGRANSQGDGTAKPTTARFRVRHFLKAGTHPLGDGFHVKRDARTGVDNTRTTTSDIDVATTWYSGPALDGGAVGAQHELELYSGAVLAGAAPSIPVAHTDLLAFVNLNYSCG